MFYDSFGKICDEKGVSKLRALTAIGLGKGGLSNWKRGIEPLTQAQSIDITG